jgi:hypothetical protein
MLLASVKTSESNQMRTHFFSNLPNAQPGTLTEGEASVQLTSLYLLL